MKSGYYDKQGKPISLEAWARLFGDKVYQRVASDYVGDVHVSTVWLGSDHAWDEKVPIIFETMVFGGKRDQDCVRYATEAGAIKGHTDMLNLVRSDEP